MTKSHTRLNFTSQCVYVSVSACTACVFECLRLVSEWKYEPDVTEAIRKGLEPVLWSTRSLFAYQAEWKPYRGEPPQPFCHRWADSHCSWSTEVSLALCHMRNYIYIYL